MTLLGLLTGVAFIAIGLVALFYGSKIYKFLLPITTGLGGILLGIEIGAQTDSTFNAILFAVVFGFLGALLAFVLWKLGVVLNFVIAGYLAATLLVRAVGIDSSWFAVLIGISVGLAAGYFVVMFQLWEYMLAIVMSLNGAFIVTVGIVALIYGAEVAFRHSGYWTTDYSIPAWMDVILFVVAASLALYGFKHQLETNPEVQTLRLDRDLMKMEKKNGPSPSATKSNKKKGKK